MEREFHFLAGKLCARQFCTYRFVDVGVVYGATETDLVEVYLSADEMFQPSAVRQAASMRIVGEEVDTVKSRHHLQRSGDWPHIRAALTFRALVIRGADPRHQPAFLFHSEIIQFITNVFLLTLWASLIGGP